MFGMLSSAKTLANAPMPMLPHFIFCIIATLVFGAQYIRKRSNYYIYLIIAVDLTLITQFFEQDMVIIAAFVGEVILLIMAAVSAITTKRALAAEQAKAEKEAAMAEGAQARAELTGNSGDDDESDEYAVTDGDDDDSDDDDDF